MKFEGTCRSDYSEKCQPLQKARMRIIGIKVWHHLLIQLFLANSMAPIILHPNEKIWVKFEIWFEKFEKKIFFFILDFLAKILDPSRQLSMPGRFNFIKIFVWQMWEKNVSWFQLFVYIFQKEVFFFSNLCFTEKISLSIGYYGEFSIFEILSHGPRPQNFWWKFHEFEYSP